MRKRGLWKSKSHKSQILILNQSPNCTISAIVRFPGCPKFVLSGGTPVYTRYSSFALLRGLATAICQNIYIPNLYNCSG